MLQSNFILSVFVFEIFYLKYLLLARKQIEITSHSL